MKSTVMTGLIPCFALLAGCGHRDIVEVPEIPSITVNGGNRSAEQVNASGDPEEQYTEAYAGLRKQHIIVTRDLNTNVVAVREALDKIVGNLQLMRSLITGAEARELDEYIKKYEEIRETILSRRHSGATINRLEWAEKDVRAKFRPGKVQFIPPKAAGPTPTPPPPVVQSPVERPAVPPATPAEGGNDVPIWVFVQAWEKSCADLVQGYKENKDGLGEAYRKSIESLQFIKGRLKGDDPAKLQIYLNEYDRIFQSTGGFARPPEKGTREDVLRELEAVIKVVRQMMPGK